MSFYGRVFAVISTALSILVISPAQVYAQQGSAPLAYAGFAFSGNFANRDQLYRHSAVLAAEANQTFLDQILTQKLKARPNLAQRVTFDQVDRNLDVSSVAFALVHEGVEVQRIDGKYWVILTMQANVLAFNRKSSSVVASYPVRMRFTKVSEAPPSDADIKLMVRSAYTSPVPHENIFDQWLDRFEHVKLREGATLRLRVTDVGISPEAWKTIVDSGQSVPVIQNQVANFLEVAIAESANIPVLPNSVGEAIGAKIPYRFSNGAELMLTLPEPDFTVSFTLRGFATKKVEKPEYIQDIYRVRGTVALKQLLLDKVYLDENVYGTHIVTHPRSAEMQLLDWDQYYKTLQSLISGLGKEMANVDDGWLIENASRGAEAKAGFAKTNKLLQDLK